MLALNVHHLCINCASFVHHLCTMCALHARVVAQCFAHLRWQRHAMPSPNSSLGIYTSKKKEGQEKSPALLRDYHRDYHHAFRHDDPMCACLLRYHHAAGDCMRATGECVCIHTTA